MRQSKPGLESDCSVGIIERFEERRLELRKERLQHGTGLGEEDGQGVQDRGLDVVGESVAEDSDEGPRDMDNGRLEGVHAGQLDDLAEAVSSGLFQLRSSVEDGFSEYRKQGSNTLKISILTIYHYNDSLCTQKII